MNRTIPIIGFIILTVMALFVYVSAVYEAWLLQPLVGIIITLGLLGLLFTVFNESRGLSTLKAEPLFTQKNLLSFISVVLGAVITYILNVDLKLGAVLGAGLVGLLTAVLFPDYAVPAYTGSFVGMASSKLFPTHGCLAVAGIVAGIVYILTLTVFGGFGGKLGTIAASGCIIAHLFLPGEFTSSAVPQWNVGWLLIVYSIIAAVVTYYLNVNRKHGPVIASSVIGVVGGVLLPAVYGDVGRTLAVIVICASFAGMSNVKRFPTIVPMVFAGLSAALVYIYSAPFIGGTGGKLGTMAFGSVMAVRGLMDLIAKLQAPKRA